jgi:hypothetical protein
MLLPSGKRTVNSLRWPGPSLRACMQFDEVLKEREPDGEPAL